MDVDSAIKEVKEKSKKRNFTQTFDLIVNLKNLDLKKPENKIDLDVTLPYSKGKSANICIFADTTYSKAKKTGVDVISKDELNKMGKEKGKELSNKYDSFFAEAPLMPTIGKILGPVLAPKGKMPSPYKPTDNVEEIVEKSGNRITFKVKIPLIQIPIGNEKMEDNKIKENIDAVIEHVKERLPKGNQQVKSILLKLTMGPPVKIGG